MASPDSSSCQDVRALPSLVSDGTLVNSPVKGYVILLCYSSHGLALFWSVGGADLVSCGGSGLVRFWNTVHSGLVAVFTAHKDIGSIIMTMTACGRYLITADMEGTLKTWGIQVGERLGPDVSFLAALIVCDYMLCCSVCLFVCLSIRNTASCPATE